MDDVVAADERPPELVETAPVVMDMPVIVGPEPDRLTMLYTAIALAPPQFSALLPEHGMLQPPNGAGIADAARVLPQTQNPVNYQSHSDSSRWQLTTLNTKIGIA